MAKKNIALIMSGGFGTRLWPLSRQKMPKPFIKIDGNHSLLSLTYQRVSSLDLFDEIIFVTNQDFFYLTVNEITNIKNKLPTSFVLEPLSKNTSPAIAISSLYVKDKYGSDANLLVLPSDHILDNIPQFRTNIERALELVELNKIVLFGIQPRSPDTGYGYIQNDNEEVLAFKEKPSLDLAKKYIEQGDFLWNSGMFAFKVSQVISEYVLQNKKNYEMYKDVYSNGVRKSIMGYDTIQFDKNQYNTLPSKSIDYDLIENSLSLAIVKGTFDWSDVGSWEEFKKLLDNNKANKFDTHLYDCFDISAYSLEPKRLVCSGLKNMTIIDTGDVLYISHNNSENNLKAIYEDLEKKDNNIIIENNIINRPWGSYKVVHADKSFKVKSIILNPHSEISLQKHSKRSEHWTVVRGCATVLIDGKRFVLKENQSTFISQGSIHKLINEGDDCLEIIEVQCGKYLGEDDIERLDDKYVRFE